MYAKTPDHPQNPWCNGSIVIESLQGQEMRRLISSKLEELLVEQANRLGYSSVEEYVQSLAHLSPSMEQPPDLSDPDFETLMKELASEEELPSLPNDFSRADIYADHD
jgi:hypothetical protein